MMTQKLLKVAKEFHCNDCDYFTCKLSSYNKHLETIKHIRMTQVDAKSSNCYQCECGKEYKQRQGLWRHKQVCNAAFQSDVVTEREPEAVTSAPKSDEMMALMIEFIRDKSQDKNGQSQLMFELVKQNTEFKELLIEQNKQMMELAKKAGNTNNTINTNCNNKFNLNVFLNETCKDAITFNDFINSIEVTPEEFLYTGSTGFVTGISDVLTTRIKNMDLHTRPFHCTDLKRETIYIKQDDKWEKEDSDKTHLRRAVRITADRNMSEFKRWCKDNHQRVETHGTDEYEDYFKYYKAALGGCGREEDIKFEDKIIKNVLKEVVLDKTNAIE
jgi:hypothetical protein